MIPKKSLQGCLASAEWRDRKYKDDELGWNGLRNDGIGAAQMETMLLEENHGSALIGAWKNSFKPK
jgi:hypothetical protein